MFPYLWTVRRPCVYMALAVLPILMSSGCAITADTGLTTFPVQPKLTETANALRQAQTHPLAIPRELGKAPLASYPVEPGDIVQIEPSKPDSFLEFPNNQPVLPDGTIDLAKYGRLVVMGMTVEEIEAAIARTMREHDAKDPAVEVRLVQWSSKVYYVEGQVRAPGVYTLDGRETVLDAIYAAGGLNNLASHEDIILARPTDPCSCRVVLPVCYDNIVQLGDTTTNYQILPGDRIFVGTRKACKGGFFHKKKEPCLPCDAPQTPCHLPSAPCVPCHGVACETCEAGMTPLTEPVSTLAAETPPPASEPSRIGSLATPATSIR